MSNALKCPNPSCPYLFDPSRVPPGAVLTCPRCAMRFTLGPPAPAAPVTSGYGSAPAGTPPGYPPQAPPAYPPPVPPPPGDDAFSGMSATEAEPAAAGGGAPRFRPPPAHRGAGVGQTIVLAGSAVAMLAIVGVMMYFKVFREKGRVSAGDPTAELRDRNLSFEPPAAPWAADPDLGAKLGPPVLLAYARTDPESYMAFGVRDFTTRSPRPSELRDGLTGPLAKLFDDIQPKDIQGGKWLDRPAVGFEFRARGKNNGPTVAGECLAVSHQGVGYWSICWAGENDFQGQSATFDATRGQFKLLGLRDKWVAKEAPVLAIGGHALDYRVLDAEGIWAEPDRATHKPEETDPRADLLLVAKVKKKGRDFAPEASLVALILDGAGDPLAAARQYVEDRRAAEVKESGLTVKFTELTGDPEGDPTPNTVEPTAPVTRVLASIPGARDQSRLMVISAIPVGDKVVAVHAWCAAADRAAFESKLIQIAGSLREAK